MKEFLNDLEGLRMAMDIESRGSHFYKLAMGKFKDEKIKEFFRLLMEEENEHLRVFTEYFHQIAENKDAEASEYLFDPEASRYITVLAESHVFPLKEDAEEVLSAIDSLEKVAALAMQAEKDSILLYGELAVCAKFEQARIVFKKLREEEQEHVVILGAKLNALL